MKKREFSAANDHCADYPFCDNGVSLRPILLLIEEVTMLLLEFIYHNGDCPCRCHSFNPWLVVCCHFICLISSNCLFSHQLSLIVMFWVSLLTSILEWPKQECLLKALWIEKLIGNWRIAVKNTVLIGQAIFSQMNWLELLSPHNLWHDLSVSISQYVCYRFFQPRSTFNDLVYF